MKHESREGKRRERRERKKWSVMKSKGSNHGESKHAPPPRPLPKETTAMTDSKGKRRRGGRRENPLSSHRWTPKLGYRRYL